MIYAIYAIWIGAMVIFSVVEALTAALVSVWFVIGAAAALIAAVLGADVLAQLAVFVVVSAVALAFTRPLARKYAAVAITPTNADRVIGNVARVTETVDNAHGTGAVYVDGKIWTARSIDGALIPSETQVYIERIEGVKLYVIRLPDSNTVSRVAGRVRSG